MTKKKLTKAQRQELALERLTAAILYHRKQKSNCYDRQYCERLATKFKVHPKSMAVAIHMDAQGEFD